MRYSSTSSSSSSSSDNEVDVIEEVPEEVQVLMAAPREQHTSEEEEEEEENVWEMLLGEGSTEHLSGEGVRQRFFRTQVIPGLEGEEEVVGRTSTNSLLNSILSMVEVEHLGGMVEFPELGRGLVDRWTGEEEESATVLRLTSTSWPDNWVVEGVDRFEEQEVRGEERRRIIPEVVPFLVPTAHAASAVVIGGREVDEVSELSEQSTTGSITYSSSDVAMGEMEDTIQVFLREEEEQEQEELVEEEEVEVVEHEAVQLEGDERLRLVGRPEEEVRGEVGGRELLECRVEGLRPIGGAVFLPIVKSCRTLALLHSRMLCR